MKKENWNRIEAVVEAMTDWLDDEQTGHPYLHDLINEVYTICEDDYCDSSAEELSPEYEEIIAMLPDTKLSLAEMLSLKETIQKWRDEHGYPNP